MNPENTTAPVLVAAALSIRAWQESRPVPMSDSALVRRYPALGSTKTYKRILSGDLAELRIEDWEEKYRGVLGAIDAESAAAAQAEIYDDLEPARAVRSATLNLIRSFGNERLVVVQGDTGTGKTTSLRLIEELYKGTAHWVEAHEGWRSFAAAMGDIAVAVGVADSIEKLPASGAARLDAIIRHIGESRPILLIDEGHHMTAGVLNATKTLINRTAARIVVAAQSTIWRKLAAASLQEAKQLILNRMRERVHLGPPTPLDVVLYLERRAGVAVDAEDVGEIVATAKGFGSYAFLRRLGEALLEMPAADRDLEAALEQTRRLKAQLA